MARKAKRNKQEIPGQENAQEKAPKSTDVKVKKGVPMSVLLLVIVLIISGTGLLASAVAVQQTTKDVTLNSVDDELIRSLGPNGWAQQTQNFFTGYGSPVVLGNMPHEFYIQWSYGNGYPDVRINGEDARPDLSSVVPGTPPVTVNSTADSTKRIQWRVMAQRQGTGIVYVAKDISRERFILHRLAMGQLVIGLIVLFLISIVATYVIHKTLAPLRKVEETATAIAGGDLERRVPQWPINTEVGSLAASLNAMINRLQRSIVDLQEKEEQMRRFVGDASHELRTPLTSVKGYAELYRSGATQDANLVVDKIEGEANHMSRLVEDLLALTRAEGAQEQLNPVDLLELIFSVASSINVAYPDRTIDVRPLSKDIPVVLGDASHLQQVMNNLIVNALKHGGEDAQVTVEIADTPAAEVSVPSVDVKVIDNGVGLSEEDKAHIFERFYRADSSRTRATGGSGLGLAISKSIVESHGGTLSVESTLGEGTTFIVRIPKLADEKL